MTGWVIYDSRVGDLIRPSNDVKVIVNGYIKERRCFEKIYNARNWINDTYYKGEA